MCKPNYIFSYYVLWPFPGSSGSTDIKQKYRGQKSQQTECTVNSIKSIFQFNNSLSYIFIISFSQLSNGRIILCIFNYRIGETDTTGFVSKPEIGN